MWEKMLSLNKSYYRVREVAQAFGASPRSVQRWMENGKIPYVETPGHHRRIPREFLMAASPNFVRTI